MRTNAENVISSLRAIANDRGGVVLTTAKLCEANLHSIDANLVAQAPEFNTTFLSRRSTRVLSDGGTVEAVYLVFKSWYSQAIPILNSDLEMADQFINKYTQLNQRSSYHESLNDVSLIEVHAVCQIYFIVCLSH